ncbi:nuclear receptor 2C2-associated protein-like [Tubulanus polymorphus]|uniref:nuclear receptor 2C2-associated protein-like n=1 Tax=Tubulanus polymorphus TaxID=672921 RepID=UPI003DA242A1
MRCAEAIVKVSSVLNRDTKQFGKKHLFDGDEETCWNSDQGSPQWIMLEFADPVTVNAVHIQFQGGFVGRECYVETTAAKEQPFKNVGDFFPEDINKLQTFQLHSTPNEKVKLVKIVFKNSTDFFGRVTIYKLDLT